MDRPKGYESFSGQPDWIEKTGCGGWHPNGSFNPDADYANPDRTTRGVRRLVWLRRNHEPAPTPRSHAMLIEAHDLRSAFPNAERWLEFADASDWPGVPISSAAESAVKYSGHGINYPAQLAAADHSPPIDAESAKRIIDAHAHALGESKTLE